ncbi:MAG: sigma-70 family RNA polymerase sigma factor [Carboxylicivirga sp.]|jgi:RNA polymerase sigma-70 factor (ECF subfamily)|nr:sigma-70 family RNA polymerase sigma factor [Carboxylicivirga sp.]
MNIFAANLGITMPVKDIMILEQLREQQHEGLDRLFDRFYKPLVLLSHAYLKDIHLAEDIVQEQFIKFWNKKLYKEVKDSTLSNYLYTLVKNASINRSKKKDILNNTIEFPHFDFAEEEAKRIQEEGAELISEAMQALPEKMRQAIDCVFIQNMKYQEAADELDVSLNTIKTQLKRGVARLKDQLKEHQDLLYLFFL